jgi:hypothetical protein
MMKHVNTGVVGGLLLALALAAPAVAKSPPAGIWEQFHFKDAKGHLHMVTEQVQIVRAISAETESGPLLQQHAASTAQFEVRRHPELAGMTFVGVNCATDKSGKIKVAVGAWPAGGKQ